MHKGVILLVKASSREDATGKAEAFLEPYDENESENGVWDWYQIGGRWSGELTAYDPDTDPNNIERCPLCDGTGVRRDTVAVADGMPERIINEEGHPRNGQKGWCNGCGGKGERSVWPTQRQETVYDVMPCTDGRVVAKLKEWSKGWKEEVLRDIQKNREFFADKSDTLNMAEYLDRKKQRIDNDEFSFESNVFDCECKSNGLPEDLSGYWAVMVDMHC